MLRHARWIVEGYIHPVTLSDIPLPVAAWLDPVAFCLRAIREGT